MANRVDRVEHSGSTYYAKEYDGVVTVYSVTSSGRRAAVVPDGALKTAIIATRDGVSAPITKATVAALGTRPTNWAPVEINKDTGELYEFTGR